MIIVILSVASALLIYRMGMIIGKKQAEEEFDKIRQEMGLDEKDEAWHKLFYGDDD